MVYKIAQLEHLRDSNNRSKQFTLKQVAELSDATASDISVLASAIAEISRESDETISGGGSISYSQITKRNVTANTAVDITLPYNEAFNYPPLEVLKFEAGTSNVVVTACDFDNGDADDFNYDSDYVYFDGYMQLKTTYDIDMGTPTTIGSNYLFVSKSINFSDFKSVEAVNIGSSGTIQIKMTATGGGKGTWALTVEPGSSALIVAADNKVYTFDGTKLNDDWSTLSDSAKATLFDSASGDSPIAFASTIGAFKFVVLAKNDATPTCTITAVPKNQVVTPQGLISLAAYEQLNLVTVTSNTGGNGNVRLLVTPDLQKYYTYNGSWVEVDPANISTSGMTSAQIASIATDTWAELIDKNIGFAYGLAMESSSDTCNVDQITLTVDMKGTWKKATHNTDYNYGYTSNTNLRVNLLTAGSYKINYSN